MNWFNSLIITFNNKNKKGAYSPLYHLKEAIMELKHDFFFRVTVTKSISGAGTENEKYGEEIIGEYNDEKSAKRKQKELMNAKNYLRYYNNIQIKKIYFDLDLMLINR